MYRTPQPTRGDLGDNVVSKLERLVLWMHAHAAERPRFGYGRLHTLVDREGLQVNHKRVYGIYREAGLQVRRRRRKRLNARPTGAAAGAKPPPATLVAGLHGRYARRCRGFRTLNIVDDFTRECVAIESTNRCRGCALSASSISSPKRSGCPRSRNGQRSGIRGRALDTWAYARGIQLRFIRPGKPIENASVESFNGKFHDECLNDARRTKTRNPRTSHYPCCDWRGQVDGVSVQAVRHVLRSDYQQISAHLSETSASWMSTACHTACAGDELLEPDTSPLDDPTAPAQSIPIRAATLASDGTM